MPRVPPVDKLPSRLDWVRKERGWSWSQFALKAKMSRSYFATIFAGECNPTRNTLEKIARAADVRVEWLTNGTEPRQPYENPAAPKEPATSRERAASAARILSYAEAAIETVSKMPDPARDPGPQWWFRMIEAEHLRLQAGRNRGR